MHWKQRQSLEELREFLILLAVAAMPAVFLAATDFIPTFQEKTQIYMVLFRLPYFLFALIAILGLKLNQTRIFYSVLSLAIAYVLLTQFPVYGLFGTTRTRAAMALAVAVPLSLGAVLAFGEGHLFGVFSLARLLIVTVPLALLLYGLGQNQEALVAIFRFRIFPELTGWRFPALGLLFALGAGAVVIWRRVDRSILHFNFALIASLVPFLYAMSSAAKPRIAPSSLYVIMALNFAAICLVLSYSLYKLYWQKAYLDELTGIPNRRAFDEKLRALGRNYSIAMIDIDHFKKFNDTYGHSEGDNVLRFVAKHIYNGVGGRGYRYGGEEFGIVFRGSRFSNHLAKLDRIRTRLAETNFYIRGPEDVRKTRSKKDRQKPPPPPDRKVVHVTISAGLAVRDKTSRKTHEVLQVADKNLYKAKESGRNCVIGPEGVVRILWQ